MAFLSPKQMEYRRNAVKVWNVKTGATRSGKTYGDYFMIPKRLLAVQGMSGLNVILGNTKGTLQRNIIQPMQDLYGMGLVSDIHSDNTAELFGETCFLLGADNVKRVNQIRGSAIKYCYGDEITTWHPDVFGMLKSRLDKSYSRFDGTCNPEGPNHWFKRFLDNPELQQDIYQQSYTIDDNPFNDPAVVARMKRDYAGTVYYDRYILGRWVAAEGLVYPSFADCLVDVLPGKPVQYAVSIDYGTMNATAMILWGMIGTTWYAFREVYHSGRAEHHQLTDDEYMDMLIGMIHDVSVSRIIIDPSAASFITLVRKRGWHVDKANNDVLDGIRDTATAMKRGAVKVVKSACPHLCDEMSGYLWDDKSEADKPLKVNDHMPDALRYFVRTMRLAKRD